MFAGGVFFHVESFMNVAFLCIMSMCRNVMFKNGVNNSFAVKFKGSLLFLNNVKMRCLRQPVFSPTIEWTAEKGGVSLYAQ